MSDYAGQVGAVIEAARGETVDDSEAADLCVDAGAMLAVQAGMTEEDFLFHASRAYRIFTAATEAVDALGDADVTIN